MRQLLKKMLINALGLVQAFPTSLTEKEEIVNLIHKLFPVCTEKDLIRLGPQGDGGYLVPNDLEGIGACFSPGVEFISGFEKDCAELGMLVFLADKSVDMPEMPHEKFQFIKKFIGAISSDDFITIDEWVNNSLPSSQSDLLLQIDIEGFEYETFIGMSDNLMHRFRVIVVEFHSLDQLWSHPFFRLASRAFEKILQTHVCVHIHPNNRIPSFNNHGLEIPPICEFTFLRRDRISNSLYVKTFPHFLDCDNTDNPPLPLPKCWYCN